MNSNPLLLLVKNCSLFAVSAWHTIRFHMKTLKSTAWSKIMAKLQQNAHSKNERKESAVLLHPNKIESKQFTVFDQLLVPVIFLCKHSDKK